MSSVIDGNVASQQEGAWFKARLGPFFCLHVRVTDESKPRMSGYLSLCVSSAIDWQPVQPSCDPELDKRMDEFFFFSLKIHSYCWSHG